MSRLPEEITITLPGDIVMPFRLIVDEGETAEFWMGARGYQANEEPVHRVVIDSPYYLGETPVTQAQYRAMASQCLDDLSALKDNKGAEPSHFKGDDRPVENVDWQDAEVVCRWLSTFVASQCLQASLPNEAQWEYACRKETDTEYHSGDGEANLKRVGWYGKDWGSGGTHSVTDFEPNDFGLYDMHGNVWEWCSDVFDPLAYRKRPDGWKARTWTDADAGEDAENKGSHDDSPYRVLRGGSWFNSAGDCRSACRDGFGAGGRFWYVGFRVCLFPGPVAAQRATETGEDGGDD